MMNAIRTVRQRRDAKRRGVAAVEFAVAAPVLILLLLGAIDLGQFINVGQVISNSSRVGVRRAIRFDTKNVEEVRTEVLDYLEDYLSGVNRSTIDNALTVNVTNSSGTAMSGADLGTLASGTEIRVQVSFNYSSVRWLSGFTGLNNRNLGATSMMRRL